MTDYYELLGIAMDASTEDIKSAYRKKAKLLHPDVNKNFNAHQDFIDVSEAYEILKNSELRKEYERLYQEYKDNTNKEDYERSYEGFKSNHRSAYENARHYSDLSIEDVLESIMNFAFEVGKEILIGETDKPKLGLGGFLIMGFWGIIFIGGIVMLFTGIGTIPGIAILYLGGKSFFKGDHFYGVLPMLLSTFLYAVVILVIILVAVMSMF